MDKQQAFDIGKARGAAFAEYCPNANESFEAEANARQYDDFCNVITPQIGDDDELWERFEEGVAEGILAKHGSEDE